MVGSLDDVTIELINSDTNQRISFLNPGVSVNLSNLNGVDLAIRVNTDLSGVGSGYLRLNDWTYTQVDNTEPYTLFEPEFTTRDFLDVGSNTLEVELRVGADRSGTVLLDQTFNFSVVNDTGNPPPGGGDDDGGSGNPAPFCDDEPIQIFLAEGDRVNRKCNNEVFGTEGANRVALGRGDDLAELGGGNDRARGRWGFDDLSGGDGEDRLYGGRGNDVLDGGAERDFLFGGRHNDELYGGGGDDQMRGGQGEDILFGDGGDDVMRGGGGDDILIGGSGNDTVRGGRGNDTFIDAEGGDFIAGGRGQDRAIFVGNREDYAFVKNGKAVEVFDETGERLAIMVSVERVGFAPTDDIVDLPSDSELFDMSFILSTEGSF